MFISTGYDDSGDNVAPVCDPNTGDFYLVAIVPIKRGDTLRMTM